MATRLFRYCIAFVILFAPLAAHAYEMADYVLVDKSEERLYLMREGTVFKVYKVKFGPNPEGHKQFEGDGRTPEGVYWLEYKNDQSRFHRSIKISYPNDDDVAFATAQGYSPGGDIVIHGQPNGHGFMGFLRQNFNWTQGCIALHNDDMDELWEYIVEMTPIEIRP